MGGESFESASGEASGEDAEPVGADSVGRESVEAAALVVPPCEEAVEDVESSPLDVWLGSVRDEDGAAAAASA